MKGNKNRLHAQLYIRVPSQILNSSHVSLYQQPKLTAKPPEKNKNGNFTIRLKEQNITTLNFQQINQIYISTKLIRIYNHLRSLPNHGNVPTKACQ